VSEARTAVAATRPAEAGSRPQLRSSGEILEETGYHSSAVKLIAWWDRERQDNPPSLPVHVYKLSSVRA